MNIMWIRSRPEGCEVSFGFHSKLGGYMILMADIAKLGVIVNSSKGVGLCHDL
jgi:hypothetical protein